MISVLSLVLLGAKGHTKEELATVLALPCHENLSDAQNLYLNGYKSTHENTMCLVDLFYNLHFIINVTLF